MTPEQQEQVWRGNYLFVYKKGSKIKCLNLFQSMQQDNELKSKGWKHTSTIDPIIYIQNLHNVRKIDTEL